MNLLVRGIEEKSAFDFDFDLTLTQEKGETQ